MAHRFFDHTGDFGVDLQARTLEGLYDEAVRAWIALLTDAPGCVASRERRAMELEGMDAADLLVGLGNELVALFETEGWLASKLEVEELDEGWLAGTLHGEPYDPERHPIARPVKAVTHHGATVAPEGEGWHGRLVYDL